MAKSGTSLIQRLFQTEDNAPIVVFRVLFGLFCALESFGAIFTGWVRETMIDPQFTFSFMGFEWLQPLPGPGMYFWYVAMGIAAIGILLGYRYRLSLSFFTILWAGTYFMQKSNYNNHYYLLLLLCLVMLVIPAHRAASLDVRRNPQLFANTCPAWCRWIFIAQLFIVFTYAALHKIQPDWLAMRPISLWFKYNTDYWLIGPLFETEALKYMVTYGGILFDLTIIPLLLWKPTRKFAFGVSLFFHLFNSAAFQIGIFPYLMIAMTLFFFPPATIGKIFLKKRVPPQIDQEGPTLARKDFMVALGLTLFIGAQILIPLRHHVIPGDVNWTEEGHRLSWRMMLRSKSGSISFRVKLPGQATNIYPKLEEFLTRDQINTMATHPDMIWQFSQRLAQQYRDQGHANPEVYVMARVSLNGRPPQLFVDPKVNLATEKWKVFGHNDWILERKEEEHQH